jgi:AGZA family xanthine/uracil permease-like MFS transporter
MLERIFRLKENQTNIRTEVLAGTTTFMTMAYILFIQPAVLSTDFAGNPTGLSHDAVLLATCIASCLACVLMGLLANYPIAQAPGMGENFFFVSAVMGLTAAGFAEAWKVALGIIFIAGVLFFLLTLGRLRVAIIDGVSPSLKNGIAVGIGIFIAFIGLKNAGVVVQAPGTLVGLNPHVTEPRVLIFLAGLIITGTLMIHRVRGAILWGILAATALSLLSGQQAWGGVVGFPRDHAFFAFDFRWMLRPETYLTVFPYILVFLFMDVFDTTGTLIGVAEQGGFLRDNRLPRAQQALYSDALGSVAGACLGTSTVTSYIESSTGVAAGGRTGLVSVTTGLLFLLALFFTPLVHTVGGYPAITAPALLLVGCMMARNTKRVDWDDYTEAIPSFLIMIGIPFFYNISDGLAAGFVTYPVLKLAAGRGKEVSVLLYVVAVLFVLRYVFFPL